MPDSISCRADAVYKCTNTRCEANFNHNDLSLEFKKGIGTFCLAVFCTAEGKVRFTDFKGGLSDKTHRAFTLVASRTNHGKGQAFLFHGIVDVAANRFHMIGKDRDMYFGECGGELQPVPRTPGLGVMMGLEVADGTTQFQPRVQARGGSIGARAWGVGCAGGA